MYVMICNSRHMTCGTKLTATAAALSVRPGVSPRSPVDALFKYPVDVCTHIAAISGIRRIFVNPLSLHIRSYDKRTEKVAQTGGGRLESRQTHPPDIMNEDFRGSL